MSFDDFWKRFVSFGLMFSLALFAAFLYEWNFANFFKQETRTVIKIAVSTNNDTNEVSSDGAAHGACYTDKGTRCFPEKPPKIAPLNDTGITIISKPRALYTENARKNEVQGKVVLRVTFMADGQIGSISIISGLPDGLTEQAINAAKGIKFEPAKRNEKTYTVTKPVEYTFTIY